MKLTFPWNLSQIYAPVLNEFAIIVVPNREIIPMWKCAFDFQRKKFKISIFSNYRFIDFFTFLRKHSKTYTKWSPFRCEFSGICANSWNLLSEELWNQYFVHLVCISDKKFALGRTRNFDKWRSLWLCFWILWFMSVNLSTNKWNFSKRRKNQ